MQGDVVKAHVVSKNKNDVGRPLTRGQTGLRRPLGPKDRLVWPDRELPGSKGRRNREQNIEPVLPYDTGDEADCEQADDNFFHERVFIFGDEFEGTTFYNDCHYLSCNNQITNTRRGPHDAFNTSAI